MSDGERPVVGLVGVGIWGELLLRTLIERDVAVLVSDPDRERVRLAIAMGAAAEMMATDRPDGVVVASPASTHAAVLAELLPRHSVPFFVEKPLVVDASDLAALAEYGDRMSIMHTWRYHRAVQELAAVARSGRLGTVTALRTDRSNWTSPRTDVDSLWTLLPHDATIALEILGDVPDVDAVQLESNGGAVRAASVLGSVGDAAFACFVSNRNPVKTRLIEVRGTDGVARYDEGQPGELVVLVGSGDVPERIPLAGPTAVEAEIDAFLAHLTGGAKPPSSFDDASRVVRFVERVREAGST